MPGTGPQPTYRQNWTKTRNNRGIPAFRMPGWRHHPDSDRHSLATLVVCLAMGFVVVRRAADVLRDVGRRDEWLGAEAMLRQAGVVAYAELVGVVADGGAGAVRAAALLGFDELTKDVRLTVAELRSPEPNDRRVEADLLGYRHAEPLLPYARVLVTLLADPDPEVVRAVVRALVAFGPEVVPLLREVRRSSVPARRGALVALAEFGWDLLDPVDRRALARLVAVKLAAEVPEPCRPDAEWFAVRTSDRQAVLDALGLSDPVPITMRAGLAPHDSYRLWSRAGEHDRRQCDQVFVTPVLDGWTLVFGVPVSDDELTEHRAEPADTEYDEEAEEEFDHDARQRRCVELSRRLGAPVYWYGVDTGDDWTAWCLADGGTLVRYYYHDFHVGEVEVGEPLPAEAGLHALTGAGLFGVLEKYAPRDVARHFILLAPDHDLYDGDDEYATDHGKWRDSVMAWFAEAGIDVPDPRDVRHASVVARRTSVDLTALGPGTQVTGHGVLALTACGRLDGHRGAFPL